MAVGHLHHFCSLLPAQPYSDNRPEISVDSVEADTYLGTVVLPSSVHPDVRHTQGSRVWLTRRAARRDAAFQAYKSLYEFGLINDNLLPLTSEPEVADAKSSGLASVMDVSGQYDPWIELSHSWDSPDIHQHCVSVEHNGVLVKELSMALTVPACLPALAQITLFWDAETTFTVSFGAGKRPESLSSGQLRHLQSTTAIFLQAVRTRALNVKNDFVALLGPDIAAAELKSWIDANSGSDPALEVYSPECSGNAYSTGIVRDRMNYNEPLIFRRWLASGSNIELECDTLPRRRNLLSCQILAGRLIGIDNINLTKTRIVPAEACTIDRLPFGKSIFGLFISAIMEKLSTLLIATKLRNAVLKTVEFRNIHHVITGISAPSAQTGVDYQRYEFFGDSVLKYTVSCLLFFQHPNWHEGYLSQYRDRFVKNHSLTRAALDAGLDAFVMTDTFSPRKWTAPLISEKVAATSSQRQLSAKVLADVVEALIGAAYMDGGMTAAQACIRNFLPNIDLQKLDTQSIPVPSSNDHVMNRHLAQHIGYNFNNEALLLEALTHPSCDFDPSTQSYQRLEFLGDAVLDIIVVTALSKYPVEIPQGVMTMTKAALVNANLLAYFCMEFSVTEQKPNVHQKSNGRFSLTHTEESFELWRFMRCRDQALTINRDATIERHRALRSQIADSLLHSNSYPWHLLCQINAEKFFSDLIESILGAIFVDSNGDLSACETFLERIGLLPYLRRVLADNVLVVHPRSLAQNMAQTLTKSNISFEVEQTRNEARAEFLYSCSVALDGAILARVEDCLSREEAEVKASIDAVDWLKASS